MEDVSHDHGIDAATIVEQVRSVVAEGRERYPRSWTPQATGWDPVADGDREPIHLVESLHFLHAHWDMSDALHFRGRGFGPKAIVHRIFAKIVNIALSDYLGQEHAYRAAVAQSIDAIAYRLDEVTFDDERALLKSTREDLIDLARHIENRFDVDPARDESSSSK